MNEGVPVFTSPSPRVRQVPVDRAWTWLAAGWNDLMRAPQVSLAYGAALVVVSFAISLGLWLADMFYLILPLAAGFMFVAPLLAVGLYETSRRLDRGEPVSLGHAIAAAVHHPHSPQIAYMGLLLMLFNLAWVRLATLLYALFFNQVNPTFEGLIESLLFSETSLIFLIVGTLVGAALALVAFVIGAVSIPMLLDRDVHIFTAMATSYVAVRANWRPMALWAGLIVVFTGFGVAPFYLGLAVALPLVGHASWHAYTDLVE